MDILRCDILETEINLAMCHNIHAFNLHIYICHNHTSPC